MGQPTPAVARAKARRRNREHLKRSAVSDITAEQELAMRAKARKCPLCGVRMRSDGGKPDSKELDHIIPIAVGGTHTHGNVRIICRRCNQRRPKDGSDYSGPVTLWAQGPSPVKRPRKQRIGNVATCRKGLHPWVASNIIIGTTGKKRCRSCRRANERAKRPLRPCARCGTPTALPGSQAMCPTCIDGAARKAAELHASGQTWGQVAAQVGYGTAEGARYAAKRIGYIPAALKPKTETRPPCRRCGRPVADARGRGKSTCPECRATAARDAAEMYRAGMTLREIADWLGYDSVASAGNLVKSAGVTDMRIGRPSKLRAS